MPPQTAKSLMKEFRQSFRKKKVVVDHNAKALAAKEAEDEELAKLAEMKENLGDQMPPYYSDSDLLSFLRARNLNVKEAENLLKLDENMKRFIRIQDYHLPVDLQQYNFSCVFGLDKEGSVLRLINLGSGDGKGITKSVSTIDSLRILMSMLHHDSALQEMESRKSGRKVKQVVYIVNLEDLTMALVTYKPAFDMMMQVLKLLQDHYHDVLRKVYLVNAPPFFSSVFKLFKPVIMDSLQRKIEVMENAEDLLKYIDADVLPKFLGGNRVDSKGDPRCTEFINFGSLVDPKFYLINFLDPKDPDVVTATVPAGSTLNFRFPARQLGSVFTWHIQSKDNDIGLGLFCEPFPSGTETPRSRRKKEQEDISKLEQLTPVIRSQCHIAPEEGHTVLWFTGNVVVHFDNTYSWMNSKEVYFKIKIRPPTQADKNYLNSLDNLARGLSHMSLGQ